MKVFLSWSGDMSHEIAKALNAWLPSVIQAIVPFISSEDIDKGTFWSTELAKNLEAHSVGVICITPKNLNARWINYEAGSLARSLTDSRVSPYLNRAAKI